MAKKYRAINRTTKPKSKTKKSTEQLLRAAHKKVKDLQTILESRCF